MWAHPATQRNVAQLRADGTTVLDVGAGDQACGEVGDGRMLEPEELLYDLVRFFTPKVLAGQQVLISAGPTFEAIDPVRGITNLSSGKMGFSIARAAHEAGAQVTVVAGPVGLPTPRGVRRIDVKSALDMQAALQPLAQTATIFIASAAVADWRPASSAEHKIKKNGSGEPPALEFVENPDILADIASSQRARSGALYCGREPRSAGPRPGQARAQRRAAAGGQHRPRHLRPGRERFAARGRTRLHRSAACAQAGAGA
jgi:phosphopantothenoylcysteine decarboxylase/phosphopantothenate--cysteine ligase